MTRPTPHDELDRLITLLVGPQGPEVTCEQCFDELDRYVDLQLANALPDREVPGMRAHLEGCPACEEDYESLLAFLAQQRSSAG
jgi:hypothetical protein